MVILMTLKYILDVDTFLIYFVKLDKLLLWLNLERIVIVNGVSIQGILKYVRWFRSS
jgi:hypothetical protein